jgi:hypothetical protein
VERAPGTHWIGGWVGSRSGLDDVEKRQFLTLPGLEIQPVSSRYTDYAIAATSVLRTLLSSGDKERSEYYSFFVTTIDHTDSKEITKSK